MSILSEFLTKLGVQDDFCIQLIGIAAVIVGLYRHSMESHGSFFSWLSKNDDSIKNHFLSAGWAGFEMKCQQSSGCVDISNHALSVRGEASLGVCRT